MYTRLGLIGGVLTLVDVATVEFGLSSWVPATAQGPHCTRRLHEAIKYITQQPRDYTLHIEMHRDNLSPKYNIR